MNGPDIRRRAEIARKNMRGEVRLSLKPGSTKPEVRESSLVMGISPEIRNKPYGLPSNSMEY